MTPTPQQLTHFDAYCNVHHMGMNWRGYCHLDDESTPGQTMKWRITLDSATGQAFLQPLTTTWTRGEVTEEGGDFQAMDLYGTIEVVPVSPNIRSYFAGIWKNAMEHNTGHVGGQTGMTCAQHMSVTQDGDNQVMEFTQNFNEADIDCLYAPSLNWEAQHEQDILLWGQK